VFRLAGNNISFVSMFKYLGNLIENKLLDDTDVHREIKCLFTLLKIIMIRRFSRCSFSVKLRLFRCYCTCFYDISLWKNVKTLALRKLKFANVKCVKMFCGYKKYDSVTDMLFTTGLSSFDTVLHNACQRDCSR